MTRLLFFLSTLFIATHVYGDDQSVDYAQQIKPILKARCYSCHGALKSESGLRLDTGALVRKGSENGAIIDSTNVNDSTMVERITANDESLRMPPEGEPLTLEQVALIRRWIREGAHSPEDEKPEQDPSEHWAFKTPVRPTTHAVENSDWIANPIDALIASLHKSQGLTPLRRAKREILLRRVYLDLIGLPPTRKQLHEFLADESPNAYERIVDSLLENKHHGERWGRHWMDVWRYSDWYGRRQVNDVRNSYPHIWRWRDWIINSLNDDKGYDQMVREMIAADELYPDDDSRIAATGFIVRNWFSLNYDTWKQDLVEHTGKAFLGLRLNCAHCHDHKYDPITQEEYFKFRAFFEPLEFRHDRVPGGEALAKYIRYKPGSGGSLKPIAAGLPRVYDLYPDEKTYMYRLGDTRDRLDRPPVEPGGPAILGGDQLMMKRVDLPPEAWYPGLKAFVAKDEVAILEKKITDAKHTLNQIKEIKVDADLAAAQRALAEAKTSAKSETVPPRSPDDVIALWRFEGEDDKSGFLADSSGNGHSLHHIGGTDPQASPVEQKLAAVSGKQAARFKQNRSFAYLAADGDTRLFANAFTLEAFVHFNVSQKNYNRTIADFEGAWTLLHRGIDDKTFELRVRYFNETGELRDVATGPSLVFQTAHDYYICFVMGETNVTLWAADLTTGEPIESHRFSRGMESQDFANLARPDAETKFKIGNSDGTGRVDGWIDEVHYTRGELSVAQIAVVAGQSANDTVRRLTAKVAHLKAKQRVSTLARDSAAADLAAATAQLNSVQARLEADRARFITLSGNADLLARQAAKAEREAALLTSRAKSIRSEKSLTELRIATPLDAKKVAQAEKDLATSKKAVMDLEKKSNGSATTYAGFGPQYPKISTGRRRALAYWMTDKKNPLTARVAVNHIWMRHFGRPLVESVFDFGRGGKKPTHPKLLDWLAVELMENDWSMKHIHRLIVTSNTYQLSSRPGSATHPNSAIDKDNLYWWKFDRRRLEAETVRDSMLYVSGQLDETFGGIDLDPKQEATTRRRSLYYTVYPEAGGIMRFMTLFDAPDPCDCYRRTQSIVPQQALAMSNSNLALTQGKELSANLSTAIAGEDTNANDDQFIVAAFERILARAPTSAETKVCQEFLATQRSLYESQKTKDAVVRSRQSLVRVLLNHNDFITVH